VQVGAGYGFAPQQALYWQARSSCNGSVNTFGGYQAPFVPTWQPRYECPPPPFVFENGYQVGGAYYGPGPGAFFSAPGPGPYGTAGFR
jgi:hypothetical protein